MSVGSQERPGQGLGNPASVWALGGVIATLAFPIYRLTPRVQEAFESDLSAIHWVFAVFWLFFMFYTEAYRGFYLKFSPCTVARAWHLSVERSPLQVALAPLFAMGFFHGSLRRLLKSWILTIAILSFVLILRYVPQPWRGLVDLGVVLGLAAGTGTVLLEIGRAIKSGPSADPELPLARQSQTVT